MSPFFFPSIMSLLADFHPLFFFSAPGCPEAPTLSYSPRGPFCVRTPPLNRTAVQNFFSGFFFFGCDQRQEKEGFVPDPARPAYLNALLFFFHPDHPPRRTLPPPPDGFPFPGLPAVRPVEGRRIMPDPSGLSSFRSGYFFSFSAVEGVVYRL